MNTDLRLAFRTLRKSPSFSAIAIVTLALGIGANVTVFSVLDALLLRPLPVAAPDRLFLVETMRGGGRLPQHSFPDYLDFKNNANTIDLAAYRIAAMGLQTSAGTERAWGYLVTGNYFQMLGVRPAVGRFFTPEEDRARGASPYAVLSFEAWQRRFGGDPNVAGTTVRINGLPYTILGVAPRGFHGTLVFYRPELWVPISMQPQIEGRSWLDVRNTMNAQIVGRLLADNSAQQATAELNAIAASIAAAHPRSHDGLQVALAPPGLLGSYGRAPVRAFMAGVMVLAGLVLLAVCANLASLLASRVIDRFREVALRLALGATRSTIARQLLTEAMLLALAGGTAGFAMAAGVLQLLSRWQLPLPLPMQFEVSPDLSVFMFAGAVTLAVSLVAAIEPGRRAWNTQPARLTGLGVPDRAGRRWSTRDVLLGGQIALCAVLVTASALSLRNLTNALAVPVGFDMKGVSTAGFDLALAGYSIPEGIRFRERVLERVSALPGITAAAYANSLPLTIDQSITGAYPEDGAIHPTRAVDAPIYQVSPGYFDVLGTRLVMGRDFTREDTRDRPPVAIVNQAFVRQVIRSADPIGRRFRTGATQFVHIVGVTEDGKYQDLSEQAKPAIFRPAAQSYNSTTVVIVRSSLPEAGVARQIAGIVRELDPRVPLLSQQSLTDAIAVAFLPAQIAGVALTTFGMLALVIALVGMYGLAAYSVSARLREIGIRIAIGAQRRHVVSFVLGRTAVLLGAGSGVGLLASVAASQIMGAIMFHASTREPSILIVGVTAMALVGLLAAWMPARRALTVDAARTLRES